MHNYLNLSLRLIPLLVVMFFCGCSETSYEGLPRFSDSAANPPPLRIEKVPGALRSYSSVYLQPITMLDVDANSLTSASQNDVDDLTETFRSDIIRALGDRYSLFPQPARGVAILQVTVTNVSSTKLLTNLRPGLIIPNSQRGGGTMEAVFTDSVDHRELLRLVDSAQGERRGYLSGMRQWDGAKVSFQSWARMISREIK